MKSVLIADDSAAVIYLVTSLLESGGYDVTAVENGKEALKKLIGTKCDAVVTDLKMPEMDGVQLIREIRRRDHYLPIVVLSGIGNIDIAVEAMREGADDFVRKNTEDLGQTLLFVIERAIERKDAERRLEIYESILPICMHCKRIRYKPDKRQEAWITIEEYFGYKRSGIDFSHGICPECLKKHYPEVPEMNISD